MSGEQFFAKDNLDACLRQLAKEFRKLNGTAMPAEIILVGGAAVLLNYEFRDMTNDVDAIIMASSCMQDAANRVGDKLSLPAGWLNSDFMHTKSYSPQLVRVSAYYRTYANILEIRTVSGEYLVAMKLMSGRRYRNDISDIVGILNEEAERGSPLSFCRIEKAVYELYDGWDSMPTGSRELIEEIVNNGSLEALYNEYRSAEQDTKQTLVLFEQDYPHTLTEDNADEIIESLKRRKANSE